MDEFVEIDNATLFAKFAGCDVNLWRKLGNSSIHHKVFGPGKLMDVQINGNDILLWFYFDSVKSSKQFLGSAFLQGYFTLEIFPNDLEGIEEFKKQLIEEIKVEKKRKEVEERKKREEEERRRQLEEEQRIRATECEQQRQKEAEVSLHFAKLRVKYLVQNYPDTSPSSPLYMILLKLEETKTLEQSDFSWLEQERIYSVLAKAYEIVIDVDPWNVVKAGKYWRKARKPERALEITEAISYQDSKLMSAILTNRGAAFRDNDQFPEAIQSAQDAIKFNSTSYYPYNLLGAIYYQMGDLEEGDIYFKRAKELGSPEQIQEEEIRTVLKDADKEKRKKVAEYLLAKDPVRNKWAEFYMK